MSAHENMIVRCHISLTLGALQISQNTETAKFKGFSHINNWYYMSYIHISLYFWQVYTSGIVSFRNISEYVKSSCFGFMNDAPVNVDMAPVFGVLPGDFVSGSGVFFVE